MRKLADQVGIGGAVLLGLGSMMGTGVFVSLASTLGLAASGALLSVVLAGLLAACNGLSSAALASVHPVSGGTYEYARRFLGRPWGYLAGWCFLLAKTASASAAALAFGAYTAPALGLGATGSRALAAGAVVVITLVVYGGLRRSNRWNAVMLSITLAALLAFVIAGLSQARQGVELTLAGVGWGGPADVLHGAALAFVAFTGYGRVATLGEEIRDPARNIPRAVVLTLVVTTLVYLAVTAVLLGVGAPAWTTSAPLEWAAEHHLPGGLGPVLAVGATVAVVGVLLNLVLGLSRVWLAMGRRGDMPPVLARVDETGRTPGPAVLLTGTLTLLVTLLGELQLSWSFSAFAVLLYYGLTNAAALAVPRELRRTPRVVSALGLVGCLALAVFLPRAIQASVAAALIVAGFLGVAAQRRES